MTSTGYLVIDFDSTFLQVEALEELADISLGNDPQKKEILAQVQDITNQGVDGKISFNESLNRRLALLQANESHLPGLIDRLKRKVSKSFERNREFFQEHKGSVFIISNGFREFIEPVVADYAINSAHVMANSFRFDPAGKIIGADESNPLAHSKGKSKTLAAMELEGEISVIGDAYTDYEMKEAGVAHKFYAFTENVLRENILDKADHVIPSFDEFLYVNQLPMAVSYPKNRIKVLILENIHDLAEQSFTTEGYQIEIIGRALSEEELCEKIQGVSIIGIRSKTNITRKVLEHANRLMAVGAFCIGTNQIDLEACAEKGVIVFNAPYSNTRSVVELAIGEIIMLMRRIPAMSQGMHVGTWNKSALNSNEIRGKKLGIIGYGNIGAQLSVLAESMGMQVYYYDLVEKLAIGNATKVNSLEELLGLADVVSLHVDGRPDNKMIFGEQELKAMKPGSILVNLSRGFVVEIEPLVEALKSGHLRGAAVDVFPSEPRSNSEEFISELRGLENVILTPHIGGSTQEAQRNIAQFVPSQIIDYINAGNSFSSVNFPNLQLPFQGNSHRLIHIHKNVPGILAKINQVLAQHEINITGQYLKTNEQIGYVITDINAAYNQAVLADLKQIEDTIKFRVLY
ncbi:phosphoglycerate dehydrogenase [Pontibacter sp. G13]|uniref:phosphoglycerate dehydrogenase n=1 Tax=Pontibacter sp. G13 TaxID=3074898 RepID=UPI00288A2A08|nr:phosphoglycerate dehydrogenase [Pontibacter sp. G13]WNJ20798.1 phosphoglycerate dehydrogenase [Pontibacter sp. G13]